MRDGVKRGVLRDGNDGPNETLDFGKHTAAGRGNGTNRGLRIEVLQVLPSEDD